MCLLFLVKIHNRSTTNRDIDKVDFNNLSSNLPIGLSPGLGPWTLPCSSPDILCLINYMYYLYLLLQSRAGRSQERTQLLNRYNILFYLEGQELYVWLYDYMMIIF